MATHVQYTVVDDLDASTDNIGTYRFALEGVEYEIDLSPHNLDQLRDALAPFITAGRRLPKRNSTARRNTSTPAGPDARPVRRWWAAADQHRRDLPPYRPNGPIPSQVHGAYQADSQAGPR